MNFEEKDLLRLSMILENQGTTTRDRYICKFVECVLFDSEKGKLSLYEICTQITERFQLEFDITEIEVAIKEKGKKRIISNQGYYQLEPKAANQLALQVSPLDRLKRYIALFCENRGDITVESALSLIQSYLYFCFNSSANNLLSIIDGEFKEIFPAEFKSKFSPSQEEIDIINDFVRWDNSEKNKFLYLIVSSCFEYCLITSNKNPVISKSIFRGKRFFLDTNIIFRIAGFNKDERRFVSKTFVKKCREVGITLCYTNVVLKEIYRVIDAQIKYIRVITNAQPPIDVELISMLSNEYEINDFYSIYYNWCKAPQNRYNDFSSFRSYMINKISSVIKEFVYINSSSIDLSSDTENQLFKNLMAYKTERRPNKKTTVESVKTDVTQILYLNTIRPQNAKSLWNINEYLVSADQLLVSWSEENFNGVPIVVIPSLWLSIILKVTGRATDDDYKSFCRFMTLRHFRTEDDNFSINPVELFSKLSEKTVESCLKEQIIAEIIANRGQYHFESSSDYDTSINRAFDKILSQEKEASKNSAEEYAQIYSQRKAQRKVEHFSKHIQIPLIINGLTILVAIIIILCWIFKIGPIVNLMSDIVKSEDRSEKIVSAIAWLFNLFVITLPTYLWKVWKYLSSDKRKDKLCSKYLKQQLKVLNSK